MRERLATLAARYEAARLLNYGAISLQAAGEVPATEASIARIHNTQVEQLVGQVGLELLGRRAAADDDPLGSSTARCTASGSRHPGDRRRRQHRGAEEHHRPARPRPARGAPDVDLTLDDDQRLLADVGPPAVRAHVHRPSRHASAEELPERLLRRPVDPGVRAGLARHRAARGLGWRRATALLELAILAEELGRGAATLPLLSSYASDPAAAVVRRETLRRGPLARPARRWRAIAALALLDPGGRPSTRRRSRHRHRRTAGAVGYEARGAASAPSPTCSW